MDSIPKYARLEIERRWLVDRNRVPDLDACPQDLITDKYLDGGRLRLRRIGVSMDQQMLEPAVPRDYPARLAGLLVERLRAMPAVTTVGLGWRAGA